MYELLDAQMTNGIAEKMLTYVKFDKNFRTQVVDVVSMSEPVMMDSLDAPDWIPAGSMVGFAPKELQSGTVGTTYVATRYTVR